MTRAGTVKTMTDAFAIHAFAAARTARKRAKRSGQVSFALLEHALRIARGDASRLRIVSPTEVIVTNRGRQL
jgi:hypothetical protein